MKYKDIKDYAERCEEHPGHEDKGIVSNKMVLVSHQMVLERLFEEIEELRAYIETELKGKK